MLTLLRNRKIMVVIVGLVTLTFLVGFAGIFGLGGLGEPAESGQGESQADQVAAYVDSLQEEIGSVEELLKEGPDAAYYQYLGDLYFQLAQTRDYFYQADPAEELLKAEDSYRKAYETDPEQGEMLLSLAITRTALEKYPEAAENYRSVLERYPDYFEARISYANMLYLAGDAGEGDLQLARAQELADSDEQMQMIRDVEDFARSLENEQEQSDD